MGFFSKAVTAGSKAVTATVDEVRDNVVALSPRKGR